MRFKKYIYSIQKDISWLKYSKANIIQNLTYIIRKYYLIIIGGDSVVYLGNNFAYDNINTPLTLQSYPEEIEFLNQYINFNKPCNILDIGANIGQFSATIASRHPNAKIYSFEANPDIFSHLSKNTRPYKNITCINKAIGRKSILPFYYVRGYSCKGSFLRGNSVINLDNKETKKIDIELISLNTDICHKLNIPTKYQLTKIDVEGSEYDVLDGLKEIETNYLYLEISINRTHNYSLVDLLSKVKTYYGECDLLFCDEINVLSPEKTTANLLLKTSTS